MERLYRSRSTISEFSGAATIAKENRVQLETQRHVIGMDSREVLVGLPVLTGHHECDTAARVRLQEPGRRPGHHEAGAQDQ